MNDNHWTNSISILFVIILVVLGLILYWVSPLSADAYKEYDTCDVIERPVEDNVMIAHFSNVPDTESINVNVITESDVPYEVEAFGNNQRFMRFNGSSTNTFSEATQTLNNAPESVQQSVGIEQIVGDIDVHVVFAENVDALVRVWFDSEHCKGVEYLGGELSNGLPFRVVEENDGFKVIKIEGERGTEEFFVSHEDIYSVYQNNPTENNLVYQTEWASLYVLATGEVQVNSGNKVAIFTMDGGEFYLGG